MKKSVLNTVVALTVLSSTFGAYSVYQSKTPTNFRSLSSVENPVLITDSITAEVIKKQKLRIEEVTIEMKKANGDMITLKKRIIEVEQSLSKKVNRATAILNLGNMQALRKELKELKSQKSSLENSIVSLKSKHKEAIAGLTTTNNKLVEQIEKSKTATDVLKSKIAELERTGTENTAEINLLKEKVNAEEVNAQALASQIVDLQAQIENKDLAIAQVVKENGELNLSIENLNNLIEDLNTQISNKDEKISKISKNLADLSLEHETLTAQKNELEENKVALLAQAKEQGEVIKAKEEEIALQKNQIACQAEEIKVNTTTITDLQAQVKKSTDAIKESSDAIKSFKEEREARKEKVAKLEKENKKFKEEKKQIGSIVQMMMSQFMMMPQMMRQQQPSSFQFQNPLTQFSMSDMFMMKMLQGGGANGLGQTGLPMFDPYATPSVINNNYYQQKTPYGGEFNDFNVRDMFRSSGDRSPSGYFNF
jgi:chromosome segregation ATPase